MTTIYIMRHSEPLKFTNIYNNDSLQLQNEKWPLSINGECFAKEKSELSEFQQFDQVYASNYVRAICTAKYFTNQLVNIVESFGERKFGISKFEELPSDFEEKQFRDFNYKLKNGESLNEVKEREKNALIDILKNYKGQRILIVGHSTAIAALLSEWCDISYTGPYKFKSKEFFDGKWNYCETFKLIFDDNNELLNIENIK